MKRTKPSWRAALTAAAALLLVPPMALASSHREAPFILEMPLVDGTDFYMFRSFEPGREQFVTLIANYIPLQDPYGGPNYFPLDPNALYEIHVDNNGDAVEDITFQFRFNKELANNGEGLKLPVGEGADQKMVPVPLKTIAPIAVDQAPGLNVKEFYTMSVVRGDRRTGNKVEAKNSVDGTTRFMKPVDYIGTKTFADYEAYAQAHIFNVDIPGCHPPSGQHARVFVGQRKESFVVNLGQTFDLINYDPLGAVDRGLNDLDGKNITSIAVEVPISCLTAGGDIIGGWTTASLHQARVLNKDPTFEKPERVGGPFVQVSRLGMPLVNEVVIGLPDKNLFNSSEPAEDGQFLTYVGYPTLPEIIELLFPVEAPNTFPRADLIAVFLTGVDQVNKTMTPAEMQRLNTAIPPTPMGSQNNLGALQCFTNGMLNLMAPGCDPAGFPNGRRPGDDVVDIALRVVMGALLPTAPDGDLPYNDGARVDDGDFMNSFPYLLTPIPGSAAN